MKKGHVYTFLFMVLIAAVLTFALAAAYEGFKPAIEKNAALQEQRAVLYALGLDEGLEDGEVSAVYEGKIREGELNGAPVLLHEEDGVAVAYAVPFEGNALWGALRGYLGVNAALDRTTGVVFTYQNETPGLGGRIDEEAYKAQFRGIPISPDTRLSYGGGEGTGIDAVTGATQTSAAVLRTLNKTLGDKIFSGEAE